MYYGASKAGCELPRPERADAFAESGGSSPVNTADWLDSTDRFECNLVVYSALTNFET